MIICRLHLTVHGAGVLAHIRSERVCLLLELERVPINAFADDWLVLDRWSKQTQRAGALCRRQVAGQHIRARTMEDAIDDLIDATQECHANSRSERWACVGRAVRVAVNGDVRRTCAPLLSCISMGLQNSVHFLCLLRSRAAPFLPAEGAIVPVPSPARA